MSQELVRCPWRGCEMEAGELESRGRGLSGIFWHPGKSGVQICEGALAWVCRKCGKLTANLPKAFLEKGEED